MGDAAECGCWLGATASALLEGLMSAGFDRTFWAFDTWCANTSQVGKAAAVGVTLAVGEDLRPRFLGNMTYFPVYAHRGRAEDANWRGPPLEVFVLDCAKTDPAFSAVMRTFGPSLVDGATIALMDCRHYREFIGQQRDTRMCQERFVAAHPDAFEVVAEFAGEAPVFYRYRGGVDWGATWAT